MISKTAIHAVRAVCALAELPPDAFAGAQEVADRIGAPPNYLGKLMRTLAVAGILTSQKGKGGGFRLARPPGEVSLFDIIDPVEPLARWSGCFLGRETCSDEAPCAVHKAWARVRASYLRFLYETSVDDLTGHDHARSSDIEAVPPVRRDEQPPTHQRAP